MYKSASARTTVSSITINAPFPPLANTTSSPSVIMEYAISETNSSAGLTVRVKTTIKNYY